MLYKSSNDSLVEILTSDEPVIIWGVGTFGRDDAVALNQPDLRVPRLQIPRRGFYLDEKVYWINVIERKLYMEERSSHILMREFDKLPNPEGYIWTLHPKHILEEFCRKGYKIVEEKD